MFVIVYVMQLIPIKGSHHCEELPGDRMEQARLVRHKGKQIFKMDCTAATLEEMNAVIAEYIRQVRNQPEKSVLTLTIAGATAFSTETITKLKELARDNTPYVKAGAIVGITGLYKVVFSAVSMFSNRRIYLFDNVDQAMELLAGYAERSHLLQRAGRRLAA